MIGIIAFPVKQESTGLNLQSIELDLPDPAGAAAFLTGDWGALDGGTRGQAAYVRGTAAIPYLVGLHQAPETAVRSITFTTTPDRIDAIATRARQAGIGIADVRSEDLGGGHGIVVTLPEGERFRFLTGCDDWHAATGNDAPVKLTHVVVNSIDAEATARVCEDVLGFRVSDRTRGMVFVRCNDAHHSVAFARAGFASLNHIAFEMEDMDAVMRGIGRMRDTGVDPSWGPGRHGPGDNVFAYYIAPFGAVVEFSTAVETVTDAYPTGNPDDWTWPPNRIDQWGLSEKQIAPLLEAERRFTFRSTERARNAA